MVRSAGWQHIVVSNHVPELPAILHTLGVTPRLTATINSAATGHEKPHPETFRLARLAAGPGPLWMVGDNPHADIAGAQAAGINAIWVQRPSPRAIPDLPAAARLVLEHHGEDRGLRWEIPPAPAERPRVTRPIGWSPTVCNADARPAPRTRHAKAGHAPDQPRTGPGPSVSPRSPACAPDPPPQDAFEIGEGCNFYPPSPDLGRHLGVLLHNLAARSSLSRYSDPFNGGAKAAFAELTSARLGIPLTRQDITFVQGGTEAVSLTIGHLAATGHSLTLPIPNYYGFDQSAAHWGTPVAAYYRHDGAVHLNGAQPDRPSALVEVLPNGVTGTLFTRPNGCPDFTLLDPVFQLGAHHEPIVLEAAIQARMQELALTHSAVIMTASKDLAMPGLRGAAIITRNRALQQHLACPTFPTPP